MTALPQGNLGKALALGILAGLLIVVYLAVIGPLIGFYESREDDLQERSDLAVRVTRAAADLPRLRQAAASWHERASEGDLLLSGTSDAVAAATLQSTIEGMITDGGATLNSAEGLPAETKDRFRRIGIRVSFAGDLKLLTSVLHGIETSHPRLFVNNLDIRSSSGSDGGGDGSLTIALDIYGFRSL